MPKLRTWKNKTAASLMPIYNNDEKTAVPKTIWKTLNSTPHACSPILQVLGSVTSTATNRLSTLAEIIVSFLHILVRLRRMTRKKEAVLLLLSRWVLLCISLDLHWYSLKLSTAGACTPIVDKDQARGSQESWHPQLITVRLPSWRDVVITFQIAILMTIYWSSERTAAQGLGTRRIFRRPSPDVFWRSFSGSLYGKNRVGKVAGAPIASKNDRNGLWEERREISEIVGPRLASIVGVRPSSTLAAAIWETMDW